MANNLTKIIAGLLIAIAVLLGAYAWMLGRNSAPQPTAAASPSSASALQVPVVVAARGLQAGRPITADALTVAQTASAPGGFFSDPAALVGRVPAADIPASSPVVASALAGGLAEDIGVGERAVAIKVDATNAVGNRVRPGNFVDVFLNLRREGGSAMMDGEIARTQARLLLSKVRVLAFGDATPDRDTGNETSSNQPQPGLRIAVLAVPTSQVDALTLGESSGRLTLALRNPHDDEIAVQTVAMRTTTTGTPSTIAAAGVSLEELSGSHASGASKGGAVSVPPLPRLNAPLVRAPSGGSIEVIRGGRAETVAY